MGGVHGDDLLAGTEVVFISVCSSLKQRQKWEDVGQGSSKDNERCCLLSSTVGRDSYIIIPRGWLAHYLRKS